MERINSFSFYGVGKEFQALETTRDNASPSDLFWPLHQAMAAAERLLEGKPIPLGISHAKVVALRDQMTAVWNNHFTEVDAAGKRTAKFPDPNAAVLTGWELYWVKKALTEFETVFAEEMKEAATYFVPRRGIYWTPALVDTADECFPLSIVGHIPQKTREDWKSAGRCLAFNLLSASGFHAARAVEGTLEAYYQLFTGQPGATLKTWYEYTEALTKVTGSPVPQAKTIAELDQMRTDYRNPIMHPRVVLTEPDARMLFANGESLIIAMAQEIADVKAQGGVQLALAPNATKTIAGSGAGQGALTNAASAAKAP
ncbi:MAG: hypothetical protein ABSB77_21840 [Xanthobacteraceae bacterium]